MVAKQNYTANKDSAGLSDRLRNATSGLDKLKILGGM
jgi:hypothetical protein